KAEERQPGGERDPAGGQRRTEPVADGDGDEVDQRGGEGDPDQHGPRLEAGHERHRHQLGLVAQLGDEDDPEADRERREKTVHSSPLRSAGSGMDDLDPALSVRVEGLARPAACRAPWPGAIAPACRPRRWELLPLARSTLAYWHQRP